MSELCFIRTTTLEAYVASDGQKFTDLIIRWAQVYFPRCGAKNTEYSINGVSFRPDGGTDGLLHSEAFVDQLGFFDPKCVFQFKAGKCTKSAAKAELNKDPKDGSSRILDHIKSGYKLVWFTGKGLTDDERQQMESDLAEIIGEIQAGLPNPVVIDANRFCQCLTRTPVVASRVVNAEGIFLTSDAALNDNPHARFVKFVPGGGFEAIRADISAFYRGGNGSDPIKYVAGEPGIGKSRTVLEAIEATPELAGLVCYFPSPSYVERFFTMAKQEGWTGYCVIDEYIGQSATTISVTPDSVPKGMRVLLIGHAHITNRKSATVTNEIQPLTEDEMVAALAATFEPLPPFRIKTAIQLSKQNLRLARSICEYLAKDVTADLDFNGLERVVDYELGEMPTGRNTLAYLSLVPMLLIENSSKFCELVGIPLDEFISDCHKVNQRSGLIQANDNTLYVGAPALGQVALVRLWREDKAKVRPILTNPGEFFDDILTAVRRLSPCPEKEEMLAFFKMPVATLRLPDLMDGQKGRQLLQLLTADPDTYLPAIHRVILESKGKLTEYPYEGSPCGRRDLIWRLRDLAQFSEYFEMAEEIVFLLALEEAPSAYHNVASSYWPSWYGAYFDNTAYPYEKRLDLLEFRLQSATENARSLILSALKDPFPQVGTDIPAERVGGRLVPPELRFIKRSQVLVAASRVPKIIASLLASENDDFRMQVGNSVRSACFSWLERGAIDQYSEIVTSSAFPERALQELIVHVRHYVSLRDILNDEVEPHVKWMHEQHVELLSRIDLNDPFLEVLEIAKHGYWGDDEASERYQMLLRVLNICKTNEDFRRKTIHLLRDPNKYGAGPFGKLFGPYLSIEELTEIIIYARTHGFSEFAYASLRAFAESFPALGSQLLELGRRYEDEWPRVSIVIYQALGDEILFRESARLLEETNISSRLFFHFFLRASSDLSEARWTYLRAIGKRLEQGDVEAGEVALTIAGELVRNNVDSHESRTFCLKALRATDPSRGRNSLNDWDDVGRWLLSVEADEVIEIAASMEQSEFSHATTVLAEAAKTHPTKVLEAIVPKLENPYTPPFLLTGGLQSVFLNIDPDSFRIWMEGQSDKVLQTVAGNLPKPYLIGERAHIPELTRIFWEHLSPEQEVFEGALSSFGAHTFNTGVFTGHGIDLFAKRVDLAKLLLNDANPAIRIWAERHLQSSEQHLTDAFRDRDVHHALRDVED